MLSCRAEKRAGSHPEHDIDMRSDEHAAQCSPSDCSLKVSSQFLPRPVPIGTKDCYYLTTSHLQKKVADLMLMSVGVFEVS